jgi:hypothetical protein
MGGQTLLTAYAGPHQHDAWVSPASFSPPLRSRQPSPSKNRHGQGRAVKQVEKGPAAPLMQVRRISFPVLAIFMALASRACRLSSTRGMWYEHAPLKRPQGTHIRDAPAPALHAGECDTHGGLIRLLDSRPLFAPDLFLGMGNLYLLKHLTGPKPK